jgi:hypothetical protein
MVAAWSRLLGVQACRLPGWLCHDRPASHGAAAASPCACSGQDCARVAWRGRVLGLCCHPGRAHQGGGGPHRAPQPQVRQRHAHHTGTHTTWWVVHPRGLGRAARRADATPVGCTQVLRQCQRRWHLGLLRHRNSPELQAGARAPSQQPATYTYTRGMCTCVQHVCVQLHLHSPLPEWWGRARM